jgi:hypothetical protein
MRTIRFGVSGLLAAMLEKIDNVKDPAKARMPK